jgi:L-lysine 6-transaminase
MTEPRYKTAASDVHKVLRRWMLADGMPVVYDPIASHDAFFVDAVTGTEYLDLFSFFASMPIGHNHPKLADEQFRAKLLQAALTKPSNSDIYTQAMADFADTFSRVLPEGFTNLFFIEGGALAVENALKVAFDWKVRKNLAAGRATGDDPQMGTQVIHFRGAFHGRTGYTLSLTNSFSPDKIKFFPKFPWPRVDAPGARFPLQGNHLAATIAAEEHSIAAIKRAITTHRHEIAALIIETIQGEGGDVHFRPEFFRALRTICDENEIILIFDEVQCGMGLTGRWWAFEHHGVKPDIFCFGKKSQVCGLASTDRVNDVDSVFRVSSRINSTWGGNLADMVRCARYIEIIEQDDLLANARETGSYLLDRLRDLEARFEVVSNVRGLGLMCALDLPDAQSRNKVQTGLVEQRALILPCGPTSLRFRPTLDFERKHVDLAIAKLTNVLNAM